MFKSKKQKEFEKRIAQKRLLKELSNQIKKLDMQKNAFIRDGQEAYSKGMKQQFNLAAAGLRISLNQKKRVETMLMNLKITSQLKDISKVTVDFLKQMKSVSKDLIKITDLKSFDKISNDFEFALRRFSNQTENMENFMDGSEKSIINTDSKINEGDIKDNEAVDLILDSMKDENINHSFEEFKNKILNDNSEE
jgi:hypothetical protein